MMPVHGLSWACISGSPWPVAGEHPVFGIHYYCDSETELKVKSYLVEFERCWEYLYHKDAEKGDLSVKDH